MQPVVGIYLRISFDSTGTAAGVARQRKDCTDIAHRHHPGCTIIEYVDNDESAYQKRAKRPAYRRMLTDVADRTIVGIVAWDQDRILRRNKELEELIDLCVPLNVPVYTARGDLDLATTDGQLHARIMASIATKSSDDTSRRVKREMRDRAEAGRFHGGRYVPYGLQRTHTGELVHEAVAVDCIQRMATAILDGATLQSAIRIVASQYSNSLTSREGWRLLLTGPNVRGRNQSGYEATWAPILDPTTASSLSVMLASKSRARPNRSWPLAGYLFCGECDGKLRGHRQNNPGARKTSYYMCNTCWRVSVTEAPLMAYVSKIVNDAVLVVPRQRDTTVEDEAREQALEHLAAEYASAKISRREWEAFRAALPARTTPARDVAPTDVELTFAQKLAHGVDRIIVARAKSKGGRFDYHRVQITWLR